MQILCAKCCFDQLKQAAFLLHFLSIIPESWLIRIANRDWISANDLKTSVCHRTGIEVPDLSSTCCLANYLSLIPIEKDCFLKTQWKLCRDRPYLLPLALSWNIVKNLANPWPRLKVHRGPFKMVQKVHAPFNTCWLSLNKWSYSTTAKSPLVSEQRERAALV